MPTNDTSEPKWPALIELASTIGHFADQLKAANLWTDFRQNQYDKANLALQDLFRQINVKPGEGASFQERVHDWITKCFTLDVVCSANERSHRFLEEALELVQSLGCTKTEAHQLVDYVYSRTSGEPTQEVGGVMVCLAALCNVHKISLEEAKEEELKRIWLKMESIRAKHATKPQFYSLPK